MNDPEALQEAVMVVWPALLEVETVLDTEVTVGPAEMVTLALAE
jgi:hypothetical protein